MFFPLFNLLLFESQLSVFLCLVLSSGFGLSLGLLFVFVFLSICSLLIFSSQTSSVCSLGFLYRNNGLHPPLCRGPIWINLAPKLVNIEEYSELLHQLLPRRTQLGTTRSYGNGFLVELITTRSSLWSNMVSIPFLPRYSCKFCIISVPNAHQPAAGMPSRCHSVGQPSK